MKALVLNGSRSEKDIVNTVSDYVVDFLRIKDHEVDVTVPREMNIAPCLGCFGCWLKTPGECIINDAGKDLPRKLVQSDVLFLLTPVTFGMYSHELKRAMDRYACPLLLPFFEKINGEIHHVARYDRNPKLVAIGVLPVPDEESEAIFTTLVNRNAINKHTTAVSSIVYETDKADVIKQKVISTLSRVGVQ
jgi:multimeric flavodoxin WrbA